MRETADGLGNGANRVVESRGADVPRSEVTDFQRAAFADPRMAEEGDMTMFKGRCMITGGFDQLLPMGEPT